VSEVRDAIVGRLRAAGCVFAEDEADLLIAAAPTPDQLEDMVERRVSGLPLEHVIGWAEFCGLRIAVGPGVFVPRRRSEFLVGQAIAAARQSGSTGGPWLVVDLCCGSGAVGAAVAAGLSTLGQVELHAADIEPAAVQCARPNVAAAGGAVYQGDLYDPLPPVLRGRVDVLVVNAPYVPTGEIAMMPPEARLHEPLVALDGGPDGVMIHRRVAAAAPDWLTPGGCLLIETSERQAPQTAAAMTAAGLTVVVSSDEELDATVVIGTLADAPSS
jgi:release factor glutamine methyltransferase